MAWDGTFGKGGGVRLNTYVEERDRKCAKRVGIEQQVRRGVGLNACKEGWD